MPSVEITPEQLLNFIDNIETHTRKIKEHATDVIYGNVLSLKNRFPQKIDDARNMLDSLRQQNGLIDRFNGNVLSPFLINQEYNEDYISKDELYSNINKTSNQIDLPIEVVIERTMYLLNQYDLRKKTWFSFYPTQDDNNYGNDYGGFHEVNYIKCYLGGYRKLPSSSNPLGIVDYVRGREILINGFMLSINQIYDDSMDYIKGELERANRKTTIV